MDIAIVIPFHFLKLSFVLGGCWEGGVASLNVYPSFDSSVAGRRSEPTFERVGAFCVSGLRVSFLGPGTPGFRACCSFHTSAWALVR